jgi:hypothetical protein
MAEMIWTAVAGASMIPERRIDRSEPLISRWREEFACRADLHQVCLLRFWG